MSLRRKSCNACFKSRRKCDFGYPSCATCQRTGKTCQYAYEPARRAHDARRRGMAGTTGARATMPDSSLTHLAQAPDGSAVTRPEAHAVSDFLLAQYGELPDLGSTPNPSQSVISLLASLSPTPPIVPNLVGPLGEPQPVQGSTETWQWMVDQLKSYPRDFAQNSKTVFIHEELYRESMPSPIRAAFGVASACCFINDGNRAMLFRIIDAEFLELLKFTDSMTPLEELARLQASVLFQIIRLFHGTVEQRAMAEQQQTLIMNWSLKLLARSRAEVETEKLHDWRRWILVESIRRTALIVYLLYGVNSLFRQGICVGFPILAQLPVSTALASWNSKGDHQNCSLTETVVSYEIFTALWLVSTPRQLDSFEKLLLIPCKGVDIVTLYNDSGILAA